jgi:hypothetical protein
MDSVGMFSTRVIAEGVTFEPVPMRMSILFYCGATQPLVAQCWAYENIPLQRLPFLPPDVQAGLAARDLIQRQRPMDFHALPDFVLFKIRLDSSSGKVLVAKEHEDLDWLELKEFVLEMDALIKQGANAYLSEDMQEAYSRRRAYVLRVLQHMQEESNQSIVCEKITIGKRPRD